ncbi:MAG: hypothetical protein ACRD2Z_04435 [Thermoanaerobaculia bacterium]
MTVGSLTVLTIGILWGVVSELTRGAELEDLFVVPWTALLLGFFWHWILSLPQVIILRADDTLEFKAPLRTRIVAIGELRSISGRFGMLEFRHPGGKIAVIDQLHGWDGLITAIESRNPNVRIQGC